MTDWAKSFSVCKDGAPSMVGCRKSFVARDKKMNSSA